MFSKMLDSVPVVGHAKGFLHYVTGDIQGGNRAMYEATRSTAVMAGGVVGVVGGPVGMAAGAVAAGMVADLFTSGVTGNPEGVLVGITGIVNDIANGEFPTEPILNLTVCIGGDALGGIGGGSLVSATKVVAKNVGKEVAKNVIKEEVILIAQTIITHTLARSTVDEMNESQKIQKNSKHTTNASKSSPTKPAKSKGKTGTSSGSGSEPPEQNQNTSKKGHGGGTDTHWDALFKIFKVTSLDDICMGRGNVKIFKSIGDGQRRRLKKIISGIRRHGDTYFARIISIVVKFFERFEDKEVTFQNFISLVEFVMTYIGEEVAQRNDQVSNDAQYGNSFEDRFKKILDEVTLAVLSDISDIWHTFKSLKQLIRYESTRIWPKFRDVTCAVYHYYKHRFVPEQSTVLSVEDYFSLIQSLLLTLESLDEFYELSPTRREMVFERYMRTFGRRLRIVVKVQEKSDDEEEIKLELSSCYFLSVSIEGDVDGDEYLDGKKL